jgi:hypothetical protein
MKVQRELLNELIKAAQAIPSYTIFMKPNALGESYPCLTVDKVAPLNQKLIDPSALNHLEYLDEEESVEVLKLSIKYCQPNG